MCSRSLAPQKKRKKPPDGGGLLTPPRSLTQGAPLSQLRCLPYLTSHPGAFSLRGLRPLSPLARVVVTLLSSLSSLCLPYLTSHPARGAPLFIIPLSPFVISSGCCSLVVIVPLQSFITLFQVTRHRFFSSFVLQPLFGSPSSVIGWLSLPRLTSPVIMLITAFYGWGPYLCRPSSCRLASVGHSPVVVRHR